MRGSIRGCSRLTALTRPGSPHSVLRRRWLCSRPRLSTLRSNTSTPTTQGFIGFGYFLMAALMTVSHGWLVGETTTQHKQAIPGLGTCTREACPTERNEINVNVVLKSFPFGFNYRYI